MKLNLVFSNSVDVITGVPQGGHLSTLVFRLFVNSFSIYIYITNAQILFYAYNIKIFHTNKSHADCILLQNELPQFNLWVPRIGEALTFSLNKCSVFFFS